MPIVYKPEQVRKIYRKLREKQVCIPAFGTENSQTTEAIIRATYEIGIEGNISNPPVVIAFTAHYEGRQQLSNYTSVGNVYEGFLAAKSDIERLTRPEGNYKNVQVMVHLDHGHPDKDQRLFTEGKDFFASVMYDCSYLPLKDNMDKTAGFVRENKYCYLIEGIVDEIYESESKTIKSRLVTPEDTQKYVNLTNVDMVVVNLGTEHRVIAGQIKYQRNRAREISKKVGKILVLHGTSSLDESELEGLKDDGIIKANIWTILEKVGTQSVVLDLISHLGKILPVAELERLYQDEIITEKFLQKARTTKNDLKFLTLFHQRNEVWMPAVIRRIKDYFKTLGYKNLSGI